MKHSTRIASTIASLSVAAVVVAGCSGPETGDGAALDGEGRILRVLVAANNLYPGEQQEWFEQIGDTFEQRTGATIEFETFASANDELTKIQASVLSGQGPDVYGLGTTFTPTAYSTGAFVELSDEEWAKVGGRDRFVPATLGISGPSADKQVGIPFVSRPFVMAYNTELLAAAGIDAPADSWDGLREQAKTLTADGVYGMSIGYADTYDSYKFIWAMSMQAGTSFVADGVAQIDHPDVLDAFETYYGWLAVDGIVDPAAVGWNNSQALANFAEGRAAFMPMTSAVSMNTLRDSAVADSYGYALMPTIPPGASSLPAKGVGASSILSGDNLVVADYSQNKDLAFAYIELVTSVEEQLNYFEVFGELPTNAEAAAELQASNDSLAPMVESGSKSVATPFTGAWSEIQLALSNVTVQMIPALSSGSVTRDVIAARVAEAQSTAQDALDRVK